MPQLVAAMAKENGQAIEVHQSTVGGSTLEQHWKAEKGTHTRELLDENTWDYVVLGDHSLSTISTPEKFEEYGEKFVELIRSKGAEPILYVTWAYKSNPLMQKTITTKYLELAEKLKTKIFPVGPIWKQARELRPDLELYFDDKHPSPDGAYLIALIITKSLTEKTLEDIPNRVITVDATGEKLYLSFVLPETGVFFRQLVDETDFESLQIKQ
tara:strand:- start:22334 stop:22972 length:639 start_codon:yes stop_codon:yes gene_type:complete